MIRTSVIKELIAQYKVFNSEAYLGPYQTSIIEIYAKTLSRLKDIINPHNCLLKKANYSIKTSNEQITYIIKYPIYCCFGWHNLFFRTNSLLVLKMRFQIFSFASKNIKGFFSDRKILLLLSVLFNLQNRVSVF